MMLVDLRLTHSVFDIQCAAIMWRNIKLHLYFLPLLNIETSQVVGICSRKTRTSPFNSQHHGVPSTLATLGVMASHYNDVIMSAMASQITGVSSVCSSVGSGADQRKHQSSASLALVRGLVNSPHKRPVTRKICPFDDVIISSHNINLVFPYHSGLNS